MPGLSLFRRYNSRVPPPVVKTEAVDSQAVHRHHRQAVYASETTGLLLIALVLLVLTLVRYWHEIHWTWR
ncbi:MAG TPA: hypothetical protein VGS27_01175 [Candidatus Sulfotelmatobacter sp.]|nr:hypothetical protein [Candidatus Sulfotelmatobacter sp.]